MLKIAQLIKEPKVSIIITYYNLGNYIEDCIFSILNQEYKNYEIIIVNDNSDEKNAKILNKTALKYAKIINLNKNKGQFGAFLEGVKVSKGEYVCLVNPYDILLPNCINNLLEAFLIKNVSIVVPCGKEVPPKDEFEALKLKKYQISKLADRIFYKNIEKMYGFRKEYNIEYMNLNSLPFAWWGWNSSSCAMIEKQALDILKFYPDIKFFKTQAYRVIFPLVHLVGESANISAVCYLYRYSNFLIKDYTFDKKLQSDFMSALAKYKKEFIEKYNQINYIKMLYRVSFPINIKICAKIIRKFLRMN